MTLADNNSLGCGFENAKNTIDSFSSVLLSKAWPEVKYVTFTAGGAEANEKAFDLCRLNGSGGRRIIAFEGSFHGRTLMALQATYNPEKRVPFEFSGYECSFVPFPRWLNPKKEPPITKEWIKSLAHCLIPATTGGEDPLLDAEIESLTTLKREIEKGDVCAVIVEPMQCEGGDNFATARFFQGLRSLTRGMKIPLIFDEIQTGFCLSGPFYWHQAFQLCDEHGRTDGPDCITLGKKAQLGVAASVWPDQRKSAPHVLQVFRGLQQAQELLAFSCEHLEEYVGQQLQKLARDFPQLVFNPRGKGYAFAFDMPTKHIALSMVNQRFFRGFMVYIAGEKTLRFRLNMACREKELDHLFSAIKDAMSDFNYYMKKHHLSLSNALQSYVAPTWVALGKSKKTLAPKNPCFESLGIDIQTITPENWKKLEPEIAVLEEAAYEPERRDVMPDLKKWIEHDGGLGLAMLRALDGQKELVGYAIGGPIELSEVDGPMQDPMRGQKNTFYSANLVLKKDTRGQGLGFQLKKEQIKRVRAMKTDSGPMYWYMTGRNRIGYTKEVSRINETFGAYPVSIHDNQHPLTMHFFWLSHFGLDL